VPSRINSTWGGNLVDMVRCTRYVEIIEQEGLLERAAETGALLLERLQDLAARFTVVESPRGRGLMCAFDLSDGPTRDRVQSQLLKAKVLALSCGTRSLRFRPVLDVDEEAIDLAIDRVASVLGAL
jgi:L-lysine 6-transaminase